MKCYSTNHPGHTYPIEEAILNSLPPDNGLFMPLTIPRLSDDFFSRLPKMTLPDIAREVAASYFTPEIPMEVLASIINDAVNFPVPVRKVTGDTYVLELFHGPTLAFKDMGARFMARVMSWLNRNEDTKLTVLVATSGDTGSAVANGFQDVEGIEVIILYPSGRVSPLQEKQLTTCGGNIRALEVKGTFDDCQRLVKSAFLDAELNQRYRLTSANSINIARLIPQAFYYFDAWRQLHPSTPPVFVVPSGNFGNLTAGLIAARMGLPVGGFIAANNANDAVVRYLHGEPYSALATVPTISNAMDVGNPSNFVRMLDLFAHDREKMREVIKACSFNDDETASAMKRCYEKHGYMLDPHTAVAWLGWEKFKDSYPDGTPGVLLETAHPVKFVDVVERVLGITPEIPTSMQALLQKEKQAVVISADYQAFREYMNG